MAFFTPSEEQNCEISWFMILVRYLSTTLVENFISLNGIPSGIPLYSTIISSIEAGGMSKLKDFGKPFSFMVKTMR